MTAIRKKLIEVSLPLEAINAASAREKSIRHGHPSTLHLWWARRPLATCRAVLFASLVDDPSSHPERFPDEASQEEERERLFDIIKQLVVWTNSNDKALLKEAQQEIWKSTRGTPPPIYDPFCGGGSIPLEAQRLGLEIHASDLNPVAVMITKALIEIPPKFAGHPPVHPCNKVQSDIGMAQWNGAEGLAEDVRFYGEWMREEAFKRIGHLYPNVQLPKEYGGGEATVIAWLWARTVKCPNPACGAQMPLVRSFVLSAKKGKEVWVEPIIDNKRKTVQFKINTGKGKPPEETSNRFHAKCLYCETRVRKPELRMFASEFGVQEIPFAIVCESYNGRIYIPFDKKDIPKVKRISVPELERLITNDHRWFSPPLYGLPTFADLFTPRQLVALTTFSDLVKEAREKVKQDYLNVRMSPLVKEWRSREFHCHWDSVGPPEEFLFWLPDSIPKEWWQQWYEESRDASNAERVRTRRDKLEECLNRGLGSCLYTNPEVAQAIENTLLHFHGKLYNLHSWVIMPNHMHFVCAPYHGSALVQLIHMWRCHTQELASRYLGPKTNFFDIPYNGNYLVDDHHYAKIVNDIERNPVNARLCAKPEDWRWSSAYDREAKRAKLSRSQDDIPLAEGGTGAQAYADAVATYLAFAVDRLADRSSSISSWDASRQNIRNTFGRQAIPMVWDYAECCPFSDSTGNWMACVDWVWKVLEKYKLNVVGNVQQKEVWNVDIKENSIVSTDPPYYDNIGYADLSDFFYVWLRRSLGDIYPDLFSTMLVPKKEELVATPYRFEGSKEKAKQFFEDGFKRAFGRIREVHHPDYPMTVFYAFKQAETDEDEDAGPKRQKSDRQRASTGWETMLEGLLSQGFSIHGTWPMRTELLNKPVALNANALASSIVLACRPRPEDAPIATRREFLNELKRELPPALKKLQHGNIAPVDLAQAAIGPGMAIYSRYAKVVETDGSPMRVRTALQLINQSLDEVLTEQESELDPDTRWAVTWFEQYCHQEGPYGEAEILAKAKVVAVQGLADAGILESKGGKVRLLRRDELPVNWDPLKDKRLTVWEVTLHLIRRLEERGETGAAEIAKKIPGLSETARDLAYRLYATCERKGWTKEAFAYNSLVVSWPDIKTQVGKLPQTFVQDTAF